MAVGNTHTTVIVGRYRAIGASLLGIGWCSHGLVAVGGGGGGGDAGSKQQCQNRLAVVLEVHRQQLPDVVHEREKRKCECLLV